MKSKFFAAIAVLLSVMSGVSFAARHVPGEVIVVFKSPSESEVSASEYVSAAAEMHGASVSRVYGALSEAGNGVFTLLHSDSKNEDELLEELRKRPDVKSASLNHLVKFSSSSFAPDDTYYDYLWGMQAINADIAWGEGETGRSDVYAAVIDSGIDSDHEDLRDNIALEYCQNFDNTGGLYDVQDVNGHGTHVAGTIGAIGNNGLGVAGVNWNVKIISLKVGDLTPSIAATIDALNEVAYLLRRGVNIAAVNMSLGYWDSYTPEYQRQNEPFWEAMYVVSSMNKAVICVAAMNQAQAVGIPAPCDGDIDPDTGKREYETGDYVYPASFTGIDNMIVVGAMNYDGIRASFSNYGSNVDIVAPGVDIVSTVPDNSYEYYYGTSMAAPHVSGTAALLKSVYPDATASQIKRAILRGADRNYCTDDKYRYADKYTNTYAEYRYKDELRHTQDNTSANGLLDVIGAIDAMSGSSSNTGNNQTNNLSSGSGGGCNAWGSVLLILAVAVPLLDRTRR